MIPEVIIHNAISIDGSVTGFEPDIGTYYQLALSYKPDILLVGSDTITSAPDKIPPEKESDFKKPEVAADDNRPLWVIPDSRGKLKGVLHFYRSMEYIKDIVILISKKTPRSYINYLNERQYNLVSAGNDHVDYKKALECYQEVVELNPMLPEVWVRMGHVYDNLGEFKKAIEWYKEAVELNPALSLAWEKMGVAYYTLREYSEAVNCFRKLTEINPNDVFAWFTLGEVYKNTSDFNKAIECFQKTIKLNPAYSDAWYELGAAYEALGEHEKSVEYYEKAKQITQS